MREIALILHFIGLALGLGTSFGYMFLGIAATKMDQDEAKKFTLNSFALSKMGTIGIILLVLSGFYLITPFWSVLNSMPLLIIKLFLVLILIVLIILLNQASVKAKTGDFEKQMKKIEILGKFSLLTGLAIVVLAVLNFS